MQALSVAFFGPGFKFCVPPYVAAHSKAGGRRGRASSQAVKSPCLWDRGAVDTCLILCQVPCCSHASVHETRSLPHPSEGCPNPGAAQAWKIRHETSVFHQMLAAEQTE